MIRRHVRPHPLYRVALFHVPRPPRSPRRSYIEGSEFDELHGELRRDRDRAFEEPCR